METIFKLPKGPREEAIKVIRRGMQSVILEEENK